MIFLKILYYNDIIELLNKDVEPQNKRSFNEHFTSFQGSQDNMSIVIVTFPAAPKVSEEDVQKERKLEVLLEEKVKSQYYLLTININYM